jgi:paraquat-inducible protein A
MKSPKNPEHDPESFLVACHECDLLHRIAPLLPGETARCLQCGAVLHRRKKNSAERCLALVFTGIILFVIANIYPFLGFRIGGQIQQSNLITGVVELFRQDLWLLAALVLITTVLVPALQLAGMLYVLIPFYSRVRLPKRMEIFRVVSYFQPWGMTEVFMLGILVSLIKLSKMATIVPGTALYAFMGLMLVLAAMLAFLDSHVIWTHGGEQE